MEKISKGEQAEKIVESTRSELDSRPPVDQPRVYLKGIFNLLAIVVPEMLDAKEKNESKIPTYAGSGSGPSYRAQH